VNANAELNKRGAPRLGFRAVHVNGRMVSSARECPTSRSSVVPYKANNWISRTNSQQTPTWKQGRDHNGAAARLCIGGSCLILPRPDL
jgi:hypothetical protein